MTRSIQFFATLSLTLTLVLPAMAQGRENGGQGGSGHAPARGGQQGRGVSPEVREQLQAARQRVQRDTEEAKRLEGDVKTAKAAKDRARVKEDQEKLQV